MYLVTFAIRGMNQTSYHSTAQSHYRTKGTNPMIQTIIMFLFIYSLLFLTVATGKGIMANTLMGLINSTCGAYLYWFHFIN